MVRVSAYRQKGQGFPFLVKGMQSEMRILIQKSNGEPEQLKLKNISLRVNLEWFAIHPHLKTFINCNRKKSSFTKFKTLGILEVGIKCTVN